MLSATLAGTLAVEHVKRISQTLLRWTMLSVVLPEVLSVDNAKRFPPETLSVDHAGRGSSKGLGGGQC